LDRIALGADDEWIAGFSAPPFRMKLALDRKYLRAGISGLPRHSAKGIALGAGKQF